MALLALLLGGLLARALPIDAWLDRRHDLQMAALAPPPPALAALVVDVDEDSVRQLGQWPLRRDAYVPAGRWLLQHGAQAVVFGMLLVDARDGDAAFARWLADPGERVILAARSLPGEGQPLPSRPAPPGCTALRWPGWQLPIWALPGVNGPAAGPTLPIERVGVLSTPLDADGVLRRLPSWQQAGTLALPALPLAAWLAVHEPVAAALRCRVAASGLPEIVGPGGLHWPMDADHRLLPWLARQPERQPVLPLWRLNEAASGRLPAAEQASLAEQVRGRMVFVGSTAALGDHVMTAQGLRSGAQVLAAAYDAIAESRLLTTPPPGPPALLLVGLLPWLVTAVLGFVSQRPRPLLTLSAVLVAGLLLVAADTALLASRWQLSRISWPAAMLALMAALECWRGHRATLAEHRRLRLARAEMAAAAKVKGEFLAHVSHEIRTPLNALLGAAELLEQTRLDPTQRRYVSLFNGAGHELMQMLGDLLDLSKLEAGLLTVQRLPFSLAERVAQQVMLFEARAQQKGLTLRVRTDPDLPDTVLGDPDRLAQVLRNLLSNAVKFTSVGNVTLAVGFSQDRRRIRFEVSDTGVGIPADRIDAVFSPYVQADASVAPRYGGTGLGLAISRRLVEALGGTIGVASRESLGSTFHVELPLPRTSASPALGANRVGPRPRSAIAPVLADAATALGPTAPRLLVADDSAHNILLVEAYLEGRGYAVDAAHDGAVALRRFERGDYRVVLLDLNMPVLDGLATVRAMRGEEKRRRRRPALIIAHSGQADPTDVASALAAGFDAHLAKPYTRAQLLALLARLPASGAAPSAAAELSFGADSRLGAISALPDSDLPEALQRIGSAALYEQVLDVASEPLLQFEHRLALALDIVPCDLDRAQRLVHDLKSLAATMGLQGLAADARRFEQALADTVSPAEDAALARARGAVMRRLHALRDAMQAHPRAGEATAMPPAG